MKKRPPAKHPPQLLAVVSDLHGGSTVGLMPPVYTTLQGQEVRATPFQRWLWECWQDAIKFANEVKRSDPMIGIINGDCIEGNHHGTKQIVSPDAGDHKAIAIKCLSPMAALWQSGYMVTGTECHVNSSEVSISHALKLNINPDFPRRHDDEDIPEGAYSFQRLSLRMNGIRIIARHHMPTSVRRNLRATQLSIQLAEEQLEAANNCEEIPKIVLMAHRHSEGFYQDDNGMAIVTGAWQGLTTHGHKVVSPARCKPSIYILDWRGKEPGELPQVHHRNYKTPHGTTIEP